MSIDPEEYRQVAYVSQMTGEELIKRGALMYRLGKRLIDQAAALREEVGGSPLIVMPPPVDSPPVRPPPEASLSPSTRAKTVTIRDVIELVCSIGASGHAFGIELLCEELGLERPAAKRWLDTLCRGEPAPLLIKEGATTYRLREKGNES